MKGAAPASITALLDSLPARRMHRRCIPQLDFMDGRPPRFLFVSGRRNRCNSAGVGCLYFAETERTANLEYGQQWQGTVAEYQPKLTFFARVSLRRVLDQLVDTERSSHRTARPAIILLYYNVSTEGCGRLARV